MNMYNTMIRSLQSLAGLCREVQRKRKSLIASGQIKGDTSVTHLEPLESRTLLSATFIVDTPYDVVDPEDGLISLREALQEAAALPGDDVIQFDAALSGQTISLQPASPLIVDSNVDIQGLGSSQLTIDAGAAGRVFHVSGAVTVTISGLTITGGSTIGDGGGVLNESGNLTITNCVIHANHADQDGGGVCNLNGQLQLDNVTVSDNTANVGGGIYNNSAGIITIENGGTISGNQAVSSGGGIYNADTLTITGISISQNSAGTSGGGIYNLGLLTIDDVTLHNDDAILYGGGIYNHTGALLNGGYLTISGGHAESGGGVHNCGNAVIDNTSFISNVTDVPGVGGGGGIYNHAAGVMTLNNSELTDNFSLFHGGGIYNAGELTVIGSIFDNDSSSGYEGGGIYHAIDAQLTIHGGVFMNCSALKGGGIASGGEMNADNITLTNNIAGDGGGMSTWHSSMSVTNAIITDNIGELHGGGIYNGGYLTLTNATISGNIAELWGGGGIYNANTLELNNATLSGNASAAHGGGIHNQGTLTATNATITLNTANFDDDTYGMAGGVYGYDALLYNTIVAGNVTGTASPVQDDVKHDFDPESAYNLIGVGDGSTGLADGVNGNMVGTSAVPLDPMLGPLADNGGIMLTHAPLAGSPAIDAGDDTWAVAAGLVSDQRSYDRFIDGVVDLVPTVDIGSVEYGATTYSPWLAADIGTVAAAGHYTVYDGVFTVAGSGEDIWGETDEFYYLYQQAEGDVEIIARVDALQNTDEWAKAGLMVRESLDADSPNAMIAVLPEIGMNFQTRSEAGGVTDNVGLSGKLPMWLRLIRSGDTFTAYAYYDGQAWVQIASQTIEMAEDVYVGLAVTSHNDGMVANAVFEQVHVTENILSESTVYDDADPEMIYTGTWDARTGVGGRYDLTTHESNEDGASMEYTFTGTGIELIAERQLWGGTADVYLDDVLQESVSFASASPDQLQQVVFAVKGLDADEYTIRIENSGTDWIYIDAVHVFNEAPAEPAGLVAVAGEDYIDLSWDDSTETDLSHYNVYRSMTREGNYIQIEGLVRTSTFRDTNVQPDEDYYYLVTAVDVWGNESFHSEKAGNVMGDLVVSLAIDEFDGGYQPADLSLREAIYLALLNPGDQVITFSSSLNGQTIALSPVLNQLEIYSSLTIQGPGADLLAIDAGGNHRAIYVGQNIDVTITGLAITGGGASGQGGGIYNEGSTLTLDAMWIDNCEAGDGGGIYNNGGSLFVSDMTVSAGDAEFNGGGIYTAGGVVIMKNSTLSGNSAVTSGGGMYSDTAAVTLTNVTVTANHALTSGSGAEIIAGSALIRNSIVAGNVTDNINGTIDPSSSHNIIDVEPLLEPLADNGGPTPTHALIAGSPALNNGNDSYADAAGLVTDQRGEERFVNTVDIGAFEADIQGPVPPTNIMITPGDGRLTLDWDHSASPNILYYKVCRAEVTGGPYQCVAVAFMGDNITDTTVYNDVTYHYVLVAVDNTGQESGYSQEVSAMPTAGVPELPPTVQMTAAHTETEDTSSDSAAETPRLFKAAAVKHQLMRWRGRLGLKLHAARMTYAGLLQDADDQMDIYRLL